MRPILKFVFLDLKMFFRNRQLVFFNMVVPVMLIVIFGIAFSNPTFSVSIGLCDLDGGLVSERIRQRLEANPTVALSHYAEDQLRAAVAEHDVDLGIVIRADASDVVSGGLAAELEALHTDPPTALSELAFSLLGDILLKASSEIGSRPAVHYQPVAIEAEGRVTSYIDFVTPGILSMAVFAFSLFSIVYVVAMRENGTLKRFKVTPLTRESFLTAQILLRLSLISLQVIVLLAAAMWFFGFQVEGGYVSLVTLLLIAAPCYMSISYALGSFCTTARVASGLVNVAYTPQIFLGGVFFPIESLPEFLQLLVTYLPLTCLVTGTRKISLEGATLMDLQPELVALALWTVVSFLLARRLFRWF